MMPFSSRYSIRMVLPSLVSWTSFAGTEKAASENTKDFSLERLTSFVFDLVMPISFSRHFFYLKCREVFLPAFCIRSDPRVFRKSLHRSCRFPRGKERCHSTTTSDWNLYFPVFEREKRTIRSSLHFLFFCFFLLKRQWLISPFRIDTFVEIHEDRVLWFENPVELTFHVSVSAQRFFDVTSSTPASSKFDRFEPIDVL